MLSKDKMMLRCQACGDAENCNFFCELVIGRGLVGLDELLCPISGEDCEWYEANNQQSQRIKELEAENKRMKELKCPPISSGDSCICPIEELETILIKKAERIKELEAKLKKYGDHKDSCDYLRGKSIEDCDCGFVQALKG